MDTATPGDSTLVGALPSGLTSPAGLASHNGVLYCAADDGAGLWEMDTATPGDSTLVGALPSGITFPSCLASHDSNPTPVVTNYTVNAGDVAWAFSIPQPTVRHTTAVPISHTV